MNKIIKIILIFIGLALLTFSYSYYNVHKNDLNKYEIKEKLIVTSYKDKFYIINLNTLVGESFSGSFIQINDFNNYNFKKDEKIFNKNKSFYFNGDGLYHYLENIRYSFPKKSLPKYWTQNGKYLISREFYLARMFGLFLPKVTGSMVISIIDPETGNFKQLNIKDKNGVFIPINRIIGFQ